MSSLKSHTEDATTDRPEKVPRLLAHLKTFTFLVFYQPAAGRAALERVQYRQWGEKPAGEGRSEDSRQVLVQFYNLDSEAQRAQGLLDLKQAGLESKAKLVCYCCEQVLLQLLAEAAQLAPHIPLILVSPHPNADLSSFSGWHHEHFQEFYRLPIGAIEQLTKKWMQAGQEKVDLWTATMRLEENGRLEKLTGRNYEVVECGHTFEQRFLSHFSLGYHAQLSRHYSQNCKSPERRRVNNAIYSWERFKNFCCLGASTLQTSTGVVSILFVDEKGESVEILKQLREYEGSQQSQIEASKAIKSGRTILSLLIANIDRFHGEKIEPQLNCKPGDGRMEIVVFQGAQKSRKLATVGGEIVLKLQGNSAIDMQIGEAVYRTLGCSQIRIRQEGRMRVCINRQTLEC